MKKYLYTIGTVLLMAGCSEDYNLEWAEPITNAEEPQKTIVLDVAEALPIDFATIGDVANVQLFQAKGVVTSDETIYPESYSVTLYNGDNYVLLEADKNGMVETAALEDVVNILYGHRPVQRSIPIDILTTVTVNKMTFDAKATTTVRATPEAPVIEEAYYYVGAANGWSDTDQTYKLENGGGDVYDDPVFAVTIPAPTNGDGTRADNWFKIAPASAYTRAEGFWGGDMVGAAVNGETALEGKFVVGKNDDVAQAFCIGSADDGAKYYRLEFNMLDQTYKVTPIVFEDFVYFIGATDGWVASEQKLAHQGDGLYTGYIYCADPNGWGNEFKFQRVAGSWDNEINSGTFTAGISGDFEDGGGNIRATAGEGVYYVELNLAALTLKSVRITNMNLVGDFNGWNPADDAQQLTWDATNYCFVITGAGVTANGWKFTANNAWDINLGGDDLTNLVGNGNNLSAVGTTIKLYPTRKTSENIYCTVE